MSNEKNAQEEVAQRLRKQIEELKHPKTPPSPDEKSASPPKSDSLRDAIHDRMRELDGKPKK
jgi:hypothetical protein